MTEMNREPRWLQLWNELVQESKKHKETGKKEN